MSRKYFFRSNFYVVHQLKSANFYASIITLVKGFLNHRKPISLLKSSNYILMISPNFDSMKIQKLERNEY